MKTPARRQGGFTLVEMIAAFVIFAIGLGILMRMLGGALHTTRQSAEYTQAALWAQSLLDVQGVGAPLSEGGSSGDFDDTYHWQLNIAKYQPPPVASPTAAAVPGNGAAPLALNAPGQIDLYQLELVVSWGNQWLQHHARFTTLRAMSPPQPGLAR